MLARMRDVSEDEVVVSLETTIPTLRMLYHCVKTTHEKWAGGDPAEQERLELLKNRMYSALMDALLGSGNI
jgi:hypothetical protein|tara:strand:- start:65 stop:277 length:213 start_codon:yes stop_codon:yes gene_type:complete